MRTIYTTIAILFCWVQLFSQMGFDWGESKKEAAPKYTFVQLTFQNTNYKECIPRLQWLIQHAPNLNKNLYVMGAEVYKKAADTETDETLKMVYQDSALYMYDQQAARFDSEPEALNYKGIIAYNYLANRSGKAVDLYQLYNRIVELNDTNTFVQNIYYYTAINAILYKANQIDEDQFLNTYQKSIALLDHQDQISEGNQAMTDYLVTYRASIKSLFEKYFDLNCENISKIYEADHLTLDQAKTAQNLLESAGCKDHPLYLKSLEVLVTQEPTDLNTYNLAEYYTTANNPTRALELLNKITSQKYRGKVAYDKMNLYVRLGKNAKARDAAKQSIANNYQVKQCHEVIGDLYMGALEECRTQNTAQTRGIFIAAYNHYESAGLSTKMANAKAQFPSSQEIFLANYKKGQTINTGCWINESVVLQSR